jgi:hypothetical protein
MKKTIILFSLFSIAFIMQNCNTTKKSTKSVATETAKAKSVSYATEIAPMLKISCSPCHYPPGGNKEPLDNYAAVKANIGDILGRVKLPKEDNRYMPFKSKKPALSDSAILVLENWKNGGMAE